MLNVERLCRHLDGDRFFFHGVIEEFEKMSFAGILPQIRMGWQERAG